MLFSTVIINRPRWGIKEDSFNPSGKEVDWDVSQELPEWSRGKSWKMSPFLCTVTPSWPQNDYTPPGRRPSTPRVFQEGRPWITTGQTVIFASSTRLTKESQKAAFRKSCFRLYLSPLIQGESLTCHWEPLTMARGTNRTSIHSSPSNWPLYCEHGCDIKHRP